jgi:uncharacterized membrane protein (DUF485 family)
MQHFIGVVIGAAATFVLLVFFGGTSIVSDRNTGYLIAVVVGAIVSLLWPWVIGIVFVRRARARQEEKMHQAVEKELAEQSRGGQG